MRRLAACFLFLALSACKPPIYQPPPVPIVTPTPMPSPSPSPTPLPTPTPTPTIPRKTIDVSQLFNGITLFSKLETEKSEKPASVERNDENSYQVQVILSARVPHPNSTLEDLSKNDPKLSEVLRGLPRLIETAQVSRYFEQLYRNKVEYLRERLNRLDLVLSRHNFYDCETILELRDPDSGRKALFLQSDMDLNTDGSDGDRNFAADATSPTFQPQTSYRWPKLTNRPNPCLPLYEAKLASLKQEFSQKGLSPERNRELKRSLDETNRVISDLKSKSFLISAADPSIVLPSFMLADSADGFSPSIGDYAAVIYDGKIYPAIVGDAGPSNKLGEASARVCREINPKASGFNRAVSDVKVTYLVFPGTAAKPSQPDLTEWRERCKQLLEEIGGTIPELHTWENIIPNWPTPSPTPAPSPAAPSLTPFSSPAATSPPIPTSSAEPSSSPTLAPSVSPAAISSPAPAPSAEPISSPAATSSPAPAPSTEPVASPARETSPPSRGAHISPGSSARRSRKSPSAVSQAATEPLVVSPAKDSAPASPQVVTPPEETSPGR